MTTSGTVLITGAAIRLGRTLALSLAGAGWNVVIHCHRSKKAADELAAQIRKMGQKSYVVQADLRKSAAGARIFPTLAKQGVKIDCLINNAAAFEKDSLADISPASWGTHMDTNLFAPLLLMRDFAAQYKGKNGNIINITDGLAGWSVGPAFLSYSLSKLGLGNATLLLARELAPDIRVNAVAPGPTLEGKQDKKNTFANLRKIIPLQRTSSPREVCDAVHYLLSAPCVTGQIISLSGGLQTMTLHGK